jgi:hypothetical protein
MLQEYKESWIKALRSREYVQGQEQLKSNDQNNPSYCCLAVLGLINGLNIDPYDCTEFENHANDEDGSNGMTYPVLNDKFGITSEEERELIRLNDTEMKSFSEIADYIENNL